MFFETVLDYEQKEGLVNDSLKKSNTQKLRASIDECSKGKKGIEPKGSDDLSQEVFHEFQDLPNCLILNKDKEEALAISNHKNGHYNVNHDYTISKLKACQNMIRDIKEMCNSKVSISVQK